MLSATRSLGLFPAPFRNYAGAVSQKAGRRGGSAETRLRFRKYLAASCFGQRLDLDQWGVADAAFYPFPDAGSGAWAGSLAMGQTRYQILGRSIRVGRLGQLGHEFLLLSRARGRPSISLALGQTPQAKGDDGAQHKGARDVISRMVAPHGAVSGV